AFGPVFTKRTNEEIHATLDKALNDVAKARKEMRAFKEDASPKSGDYYSTSDFNREFNKRFQAEFNAELRAGLAVAEALKRVQATIAHPSVSAFTRQDVKKLFEIPPGETRFAAAQAMINFTKGLEAEGKLPKG